MKYLILTATLLLASPTWARSVPDLVCRETRFVFVDPISLDVQTRDSTTVYRFKSGSLYIKPIDRGEYRYNKVVEVESMRYTSGHKVFQFGSGAEDFDTAVLVHTYRDEVRVSRVTCSRP